MTIQSIIEEVARLVKSNSRKIPSTQKFAFVPIYGLIALLSYFSQIVVVPHLVELAANPQHEATATVLLRQMIQIWPESSLQQKVVEMWHKADVWGMMKQIGTARSLIAALEWVSSQSEQA